VSRSLSSKPLIWLLAAALCIWVLAVDVSPDFTPVRSELANARGFSRGLLNFVVLRGSEPFAHVPGWSVLACGGLVLLLAALGPAVRLPSAISLVFLGAVALSPFVTPYRVVLAPRTFALCLLLLAAAPARQAGTRLVEWWSPLTSGFVAAGFFASAMLQALSAYGGNYSGFIHLSREVADRAPLLQERPDVARSLITYDAGYDGQFMYLMAFDPLLRRFADRPQVYRAFVDNPPYRYGRIGFSLLTNVVSAGEPERFPAAMMWLIVMAHFALGALLAALAVRHGMSPLAGLWYLAIPGFTTSLMSALPEALAAAGLVAGVVFWEARRPALAALAFASALLVRETGVILLLAVVVAGSREEWKRSALLFAASVAPVAAWRVFVASRLYSDFGRAAILTNPGDLGTPFAGLLQLWRAGVDRIQPSPEVAGALVFPLILAAAFVLALRLLSIRRGPFEVAAAVYAVIAVSLNYEKIWTHLPSGERGTFELFLCLLLLLLESDGRPMWVRRALTGLFVALVCYTFMIAPDAGTSRSALLLIR
jgi:hypothetical protein